ncbi:YcaO-like family protein [Allomesorhizobium camelthorni]|nr:YcaO-like family protein [Mesorhizobium camelthorni]
MGCSVLQGRTFKRQTHRSLRSAETLDRVLPLRGVVGVTRLANVTGLDSLGIPVFTAIRPNSRSLSVAHGKGTDEASAKASALMEAVELYCAEHTRLPLRLGRYCDLSPDNAIDVALLPHRRGRDFDPELPILWTWVTDICRDTNVLVPFEMIHTDFTLPLPQGTGFFPMTSTGLASGNCLAEALVHGLCEVIERDAYARWQSKFTAKRTAVDIDTIACPMTSTLVDRILGSGCTLQLEDITTDVGVPVLFAQISGAGEGSLITERPAGGFGCHPDRNWACVRAITEAVQSRMARIVGLRDDLTGREFASSVPREGNDEEKIASKSINGIESAVSELIEEDLRWVLGRLRKANRRSVLVADLSPRDAPFCVVKVIVPGLASPSV